MNVISELELMRAQAAQWRKNRDEIALIPTMGHLHAGHASLIEMAHSKAQRIVVSIFVNPLQFNHSDDLARYPRTLNEDLEQLQRKNVDAVFTPQEAELYPNGIELAPRIHIPQLSEDFCGQYRPGHFAGVCTIVAKLFNIITPNCAIFGSKDYQQLLIIQRMVQELNLPVEIFAGETVRETDGLALSSRNSHLTPQERNLAPKLYTTLKQIRQNFAIGQIDQLEQSSMDKLNALGFDSEYLAIRDASNLQKIEHNTKNIVVLVAARLGSTRLIDNIQFRRP